MADQITIKPSPESESSEPPTGSGNENQSVSLNLSQAVSLCAVGLLICFFLPWISFFLGKPSGLDFAKEGGRWLLLWSIPIFCVLTIFAGITKRSQKIVAQFTGALPFFVLGFGLYHEGKDLLRVLEIGAYAGLALGLVLFFVARRLK